MKSFFTITLSVLIAVVLIMTQGLRARRNKLNFLLYQVNLLTCISIAFNLVSIISIQEKDILFFQGMYYASTAWLLIAFYRFVLCYTDSRLRSFHFSVLFLIASMCDTFSFIMNVHDHHAFTTSEMVWFDNMSYHIFHTSTPYYHLHLILSYLIAVLTLVVLIERVINASPLYRRKYLILLVVFSTILILDGLYTIIQIPLDLALILYLLFVCLIYYSTQILIPRDLIVRVLTYAVTSMHNAVACFDMSRKMIFSNPECYSLLHLDKKTDSLRDHMEQKYKEHNLSKMQSCHWIDSLSLPDQTKHLGYDYQRIKDEQEHDLGYYITITDRTIDVNALEMEHERATHDSLTGLYNREGFFEKVQEVLSKSPEIRRYMISTNIRDFKLINDLFGSEKGNEVLCRIAQQLCDPRYHIEVSSRLFGDHFAILMQKEKYSEATVAEIVEAVSHSIESNSYRIQFQIGVYEIKDLDILIPTMYERAAMARSSVSHDNVNSIAYYTPEMLQQTVYENRILNELNEAMQQKELQLYLQPQSMADGTILGAEALIRWIKPDGTMLMPGDFIPVLEKTGYIYQLDLFVWETAARLLYSWKDTPMEQCYISVNISPKDFYFINIYDVFLNLTKKYGIQPEKLHLEITETALMNNNRKQFSTVANLQNYGFKVEIDDFGSGYSSLCLMKDMKADTLKIDMSLLREMSKDRRNRTILAYIIAMARDLGMMVISEGVEEKEQIDFLLDCNCDVFQGYYFSKPIPVSAFEERYCRNETSF